MSGDSLPKREGFEKLIDLDKYVGKYVDIEWDNEGASGWVSSIGPVEESQVERKDSSLINALGRNVILDYGMGVFVMVEGVSIKEVDPPPNDKGIFIHPIIERLAREMKAFDILRITYDHTLLNPNVEVWFKDPEKGRRVETFEVPECT